MDALHRNQTWTLVPSDSANKIVGNKWIFRVKYNPDGSISKYKARRDGNGADMGWIYSAPDPNP